MEIFGLLAILQYSPTLRTNLPSCLSDALKPYLVLRKN